MIDSRRKTYRYCLRLRHRWNESSRINHYLFRKLALVLSAAECR
jgi:hypothetical protein